MIQKKKICNNCGFYGHTNRHCTEPITSMGIIGIKLDCDKKMIDMLKKNYVQKSIYKDNVNIILENEINLNKMKFVKKLKEKVKFLLVQRKHTIGFVEFIHGNYKLDNPDDLIYLFQQMTREEMILLRDNNFKFLWKEMWKMDADTYYKNEFETSQEKFNKLKNKDNSDIIGLNFYINNVVPKFKDPQWGFPKGRRKFNEKNIDCAKRELCEETSYLNNEYISLEKIIPLEENILGTNKIIYKHKYYLTLFDNNIRKPLMTEKICKEIGNIKWFNYDEAKKHIRGYHKKKILLLNEILLFLATIFSKIK